VTCPRRLAGPAYATEGGLRTVSQRIAASWGLSASPRTDAVSAPPPRAQPPATSSSAPTTSTR
jgi:hypothetical protein